jgi:hypothetical protein
MSSFSLSRLFPSWFSPPSNSPNPALSVDNVMDEQINTPRSVELNPPLNKTKRPKQTKTKTAKAKRQEVSSSFDDVTMKDAAPNPTLSVDNVEVEEAIEVEETAGNISTSPCIASTCSSSSVSSANSIVIGEGTEHLAGKSPCNVISTYDG